MTRDEIYEQLNEQRHFLLRRECTPRIMSESGVDALLDALITIQHSEALEILEEEANGH